MKKQDFRGKMGIVAIALRCSLALGLLAGSALTASAAWLATGPFGGDADIVRTIPESKGHVIASARNGLIFSSLNGGASWASVPFPAQFAGVLHALEVDPRSGSTWYAGVEGDLARVSGVYKTTDSGATWSMLAGTQGIAVWSLAFFPGDSSVVAAGSGSGIYLTRDAGSTWKHISPENDPELRPVVSLAFDPANSNTLYAGTTHLPWRTADGGAHWQSIHTGMIDDSDVFSIQVEKDHPEHVMASACSGVYNSLDGAGHWAKLETPKGAFRTHFVAFDPRHQGIVFAGTTEGLLRSENSGKTWRVVSTYSIRSIAFDPQMEGRVFFAASGGGPMVSNDEGVTLRESNIGFTNRNFTSVSGSGSALYAGSVYEGAGGVYRTDNLAVRWTRGGSPAGDQVVRIAAAPDDPKRVFAAGYHGLFESKDGGNTWTARKSPTESAITSLLPLPGGALLAGTAAGLFRTGADGAWKSSATESIQSLHQSSGNTVTALTATGGMMTTDDGSTWRICGAAGPKASWYGLTFDAAAPDKLALAATSEGLFRSTDGCRTWAPVRGGLDSQTVGLVMFHPTHKGEAFASQGGRIFVSTDGGQSWLTLDDEPAGNAGPSSLFVLSAAPDRLFALFPRRGVYSTGIGVWNTPLVGSIAGVAARR